MFNGVRQLLCLLAAGAVSITSGCALTGPHAEVIKSGKITVLAVDGPPHLTHLTPFNNSIYVSAMDGRQNFADAVNAVLAQDGYDVVMKSDTATLLTTRELYAGPADRFTPEETHSTGLSVLDYGRMGLQGALCLALHACSDPVVMTNALSQDVDDDGMNELGRRQGDERQKEIGGRLLVVSQLCSLSSCGASYASTDDPQVTLNDLRVANAEIGIPQILRAKPKASGQ